MATYSWSMSLVKRSDGRSVVAAAAYYAREALRDERTDKVHDYRDRGDLVYSEIMLPKEAPEWCRELDREELWNQVEAVEKRKDAQLGRSLRVMIPRELSAEDRIQVIQDYVRETFTSRGMIADVSWHCPPASTGGDNPHAHILLTLRTLGPSGWGPKSRHDMVPDPAGRVHPDGHPVLVESNASSWNSPAFFSQAREDWEKKANDALSRAGSDQRIDRRSLLERGLARVAEPPIALAMRLKELKGGMTARWGQFVAAKHWQATERRAKAAFRVVENDPAAALVARAQARAAAPRREETPIQKVNRFTAWIERQLDRLALAPPGPEPDRAHGAAAPERAGCSPSTQTPDMER